MVTHRCQSCDVLIQASDVDTLDWGIETHSCSSADPTERVVDYLAAHYRRPFWLVRPGTPRILVR